ncbi:YceI family protein [Corynebacterium urogenitale]
MSSINNYSGSYAIDASHSELGFVARHAMVTKVRGSFTEFTGTASSEENLQNAEIKVDIDVKSVDTRNEDRDAHLISDDFFDAENHPKITFASTEVTAKDDATLSVTGDLTIKGVTKSVTIDFDFTGEVVDPWGQTRVGFEGSTTINRKDFGLTWNTTLDNGGVLVSEKITLNFDISAVKQ